MTASVVTTSISKAAVALGIERSSVERLIEARGLVGDVEARWVECDLGWSRRDLWMRLVARGYEFADETDATDEVELKRMLNVQDEPWDDGFLQVLVEVRGGQRLLAKEARTLLRGPEVVRITAVERYRQLAATARATGAGAYHPPMEIEELAAGQPDELQGLPGTCLDGERSILFDRPDAALVGRVAALPEGHWRDVGYVVALLHDGLGGMRGREQSVVALLEHLQERVGEGRVSDPRAMSGVLDDLVDAVTDREGALAMVNSYQALRDLINAYIDWQRFDPAGPRGRVLASLLPAELPPTLKRLLWKKRESIDASRLRARQLSASEVARRASDRLVCLEARLRQCDRLSRVVDQRIRRIEKDWAEGRNVQFPVRVSDTWRVVRPDGTIAPGLRQIVSVEIVQEDALWLESAVASGWRRDIEAYLDAATRAMSPERVDPTIRRRTYAAPVDGRYFEAGGDRRLFVRYVDTRPADAAEDEHHEPYWVEPYRMSALVTSRHMSREQVKARRAYVDHHRLDRAPRAMMGLSWWPKRSNHNLAHYLLRYTGGVLLPIKPIRLMIAYGAAVGRMELMSGTRIGETMQAREGGCFSEVELKGRKVASMRGRAKGAPGDRRWIVDRETMKLLRRIKDWVIEMWYGDDGALPVVEYGEAQKNRTELKCPPARYLFQIGGKAADNEILNRCLTFATLNLPHARSHDYRYAFAKLLAIRGATGKQRARAMSHEEGSEMVPRYGDWDCEGLEEDDLVVAELQDALLQEFLDKLIDGGVRA